VPRSIEGPFASHDVDAAGTIRLLLAPREARVRRVGFAAASSVYGDQPVLPVHEQLRPQPISPCGASTPAGEHDGANVSRGRLGYRPRVGFTEGLRRTVVAFSIRERLRIAR
jgi:nucleoside-diphosphate-sugar epimerase